MNVKKILNDFAIKHKIIFQEDGEVGFGRPCVGFMHGDNYIDYNPTSYEDDNYDYIKDIYSETLSEIAPAHAYHKHTCLCVLVDDITKEKALEELAVWVTKLEALDVYIVTFLTGATGLQAVITGTTGKALKINSI